MSEMADRPKTMFRLYQGHGSPPVKLPDLPAPPPWRSFEGDPDPEYDVPQILEGSRDFKRAASYKIGLEDTRETDKVNAALFLRRPLLVTGRPGSGKSTLAYSVACELGLGEVLYWPITSRSTLQQGLYRYDAIARLQDRQAGGENYKDDVGRYIELGPLGTALLPVSRPRVLLIDEIDKSDIDLPNDLLNIFEEGWFEIPELARITPDEEQGEAEHAEPLADFRVRLRGSRQRVRVRDGRVVCHQFPLIFMTSNGERDFPPAFLRRCLSLEIRQPETGKLEQIVDAHFGEGSLSKGERNTLIADFLKRRGDDKLATDQLLNAVFLTLAADNAFSGDRDALEKALFEPLTPRG